MKVKKEHYIDHYSFYPCNLSELQYKIYDQISKIDPNCPSDPNSIIISEIDENDYLKIEYTREESKREYQERLDRKKKDIEAKENKLKKLREQYNNLEAEINLLKFLK